MAIGKRSGAQENGAAADGWPDLLVVGEVIGTIKIDGNL